jgi:hypothetical protein
MTDIPFDSKLMIQQFLKIKRDLRDVRSSISLENVWIIEQQLVSNSLSKRNG